MKLTTRRLLLSLLAIVALASGTVCYLALPSGGHPSAYTPRDPALRQKWLYFYPSRREGPPDALIVFLGNDVAFWAPHQDLAWRLSGVGYAVVGVDMREFLHTLPSAEPQRDSAFGPAMSALIARTRAELKADDLPVIVGGHSLGAEVAFWIALHVPPPRLVGVLALNPRSTGHLFITAGDLLNHEASGAWSWSTVDAARRIDPQVRIALVRSSRDPFRKHDPEFIAAGGARLRHYLVPMASHSMKSLLVAGPMIEQAVSFLITGH